MDPRSILHISAVLFAIVAELQLADRAKRLAAAEVQLDAFPGGFGHMANAIIGMSRIDDALRAEKRAIAARDLTGSTFSDDEWHDMFTGNTDLFEAFLEQMLEDLAPDIYEPCFGSPARDLFQDQIEELTQGDALARMVLLKGDVRPRELAAIPPGDRVAFLHGRCSNATREAHKEREAMLANIDFDLALDGATDGEQADA